MKLEPDKQIDLTQDVLSVVLNSYRIYDFTFTPINEGISNSSAKIESGGKKYVVRIYAQGKNNDSILLEIAFQNYLRGHGIPIPVIHKNDAHEEFTVIKMEGKTWQVILMDFIEGQSVTTNLSLHLISELATTQAKMHLLGIEFAKNNSHQQNLWPDLHDGLVSKVENTSVGGHEVRDLFKRIREYCYPLSPKLPYGYNHLDLDFDGNVLTKSDQIAGIIDFDDLQYSPVVACLGFSLWNILDDEGVDAAKHYLSEYEKIRPLTSDEHDTLPNVIFFRNYAMVIIRLLLWDKETPITDLTDLIKLEGEIPTLSLR